MVATEAGKKEEKKNAVKQDLFTYSSNDYGR